MSSYLPNYPHGGNGRGSHQYAYNLRDQTVESVPSGVCFHLSQIDARREEFGTLEKGIDPFNIFPTFHNRDGGYVLNTSDTTSTSSTSKETRCLPLLDVNVDVDVQSSIAKTKVTQAFTNMSNYVIKETNYSFPLYDGSAVISFRCHVGDDKLLEGVIKPKDVSPRVTLTRYLLISRLIQTGRQRGVQRSSSKAECCSSPRRAYARNLRDQAWKHPGPDYSQGRNNLH